MMPPTPAWRSCTASTYGQAGKLKPLEAESDLPFYVDVLGAVDKRKSFLGVPYKGIMAMTTVEQAGEIADR